MKKIFRMAIVFAVAGAALLTGCTKDYGTEISDLQSKVSDLTSKVNDLQSQITAGAVITAVDNITNGVKVTLSNGKSWEITNGKDGANGKDGVNGTNGKDGKDGTDGKDGKDGVNGTNGTNGKDGANGKDGKDGTVVTISDDGYWVLDGVKTDKKAIGTDGTNGKDGVNGIDGTNGKDGENGKDGANGKDGISWQIKEVNGVLSFVSNEDPATVVPVFADGKTPVTAVWTDEGLKIYNVEGVDGGVVTINTAVALASIIGVPQVYFEGVEAFEYYHVEGRYKNLTGTNVNATDPNATPAVIKKNNTVTNVTGAAGLYNIGESATAQYWVNPAAYDATKNSEYALTGGDYEVVTRGVANWTPSFKSIAVAEKNLYNVKYTIANADKLMEGKEMSTMNFRIKDVKSNKEVNSDYLAIVPRQEAFAAIAFTGTQPGVACVTTTLKNELYASAKDAVEHDPSVTVGYKQVEGLKLNFFNIHFNPAKEGKLNEVDDTKHIAKSIATVASQYPVELQFELVDVVFGANTTSENAYGVISDGVFYPAYAGTNGQAVQITSATDEAQGISAVNRTPVVLVKLVDTTNKKIVLAGYFKIQITKDEAKPVSADFILKDWTSAPFKYLCTASQKETNWIDMSYGILESEIKMDYEAFHNKFTWEAGKTYYKDGDSFIECGYKAALPAPVADATKNFGTVAFTKDTGVGAINDKFTVSLTKAQADNIGIGKTKTLYAHFTALDQSSIYIGFTVKVGEKPVASFVTKNPVYWFTECDATGDDAPATVRNNVRVPEHYGDGAGLDADVTDFTKKIDDDWVGNKVTVNITPALTAAELAAQPVAYKYSFSKNQPKVGDANKAFTVKNATTLQYNGVDVITIEDQATGEIKYACNATTKALINWATNPADAEPNARLLYCNVDLKATLTEGGADCMELGTSQIHVRFLRPVDFGTAAADHLVDGVPGVGSTIEIGKLFSAKDWQGYNIFYFDTATNAYKKGVYPETGAWLVDWYGYYGIANIKVDLNNVMTSQAQAAGKFAKLKDVNAAAIVGIIDTSSNTKTTAGVVNVDITDINKLANYLFSYQNNMGYADDFKLQIPVTIDYAWGTFETKLTVDVWGTKHNYQD